MEIKNCLVKPTRTEHSCILYQVHGAHIEDYNCNRLWHGVANHNYHLFLENSTDHQENNP